MPRVPRRVYLDSGSTTAVHPDVLKTYKDLLDRYFVNSESLYDEGSEVHRMMEKARSAAAGLLGVKADEILFTSGSSESNSMAIKGSALADPSRKHLITTSIEHSSVMNSMRQLQRLFGYEVTYLPVSEQGTVTADQVRKALRPDTVLVSIMQANNETGAINPISDIAEVVQKESHALFHVDMTQAIGKIPCPMDGIDLASISAHKIEGLKGSGILMRREYVKLEPIISGGEQEFGLRGGTANAPADIVFAKTLRLALENETKYETEVRALQQRLIRGLKEIPGIELNSPEHNLPCTVNFSYEKIPSEVMQNALNRQGFLVSARSTCESNSNNPSYVLTAMGYSDRRASCSIRIVLSYHNTEEDVDRFLSALKEIIRHYGEL